MMTSWHDVAPLPRNRLTKLNLLTASSGLIAPKAHISYPGVNRGLKPEAAQSVRRVLRSTFRRGRLSLLVLPVATGKAEFHAVSSFRLTIRVQ